LRNSKVLNLALGAVLPDGGGGIHEENAASPSGNIISRHSSACFREQQAEAWFTTKSQFLHLDVQCSKIRLLARQSILRRESSLVELGLFFVIRRN